MKNVLIVSGHPDLTTSIANQVILDETAKLLPNAEIRKLDQLFKNGTFDIAAEQAAILNADIIVLQFPFSWFSFSGVMKLWLDEVFEHGFAHGSTAKLAGKKLIISTTTGAPSVLYQKDGFFEHTMEEFAPQFEMIAKLCNLDYTGFIYTNGIGYTSRENQEKINAQKQEAKKHAERLVVLIKQL
ncbi:NAD(P)H-dependent oxidoreductase [Actinobacillus equuli]|uniref:NAD(P)H-dependent oxidoreductase n=1 Tax=Actinobacillus equuli TaxID=718 RepID=UPI00244103E4|nr:NAD(P)H-dependent oxidoreductase [Actinobacillus equuli]WGE59320.1 NAD(P)H-dependent oxidoreductase [Actinobacillus equuli subsp. haemolyticus]WGE62038.1 NAD(P)H-dependent oxidoreductase [Actinobacillus equuli subsp. haemolyticus]